MITLNKLLSVKIKKMLFLYFKGSKRKLENKTKNKMLLFLTRFNSLLHFPMFSGGIAMQHWAEMG